MLQLSVLITNSEQLLWDVFIMFRCVTQISLTVLILLSYLNSAQSSPYITDRGLIELKDIANELLAEIAKKNDYTLHTDYTYLDVPASNIITSVKEEISLGAAMGAPLSATGGAAVGTMAGSSGGPIGAVTGASAGATGGGAVGASLGALISALFAIPKPAAKFANYAFTSFTAENRDSIEFLVNDPAYNPNPNRLEVHYKVTSDTYLQYPVESSCFAHLARIEDHIDGELDECVWENIFPQEIPGSLRIGTSFDKDIEYFFGETDTFDRMAGQTYVVTRFQIYDPVH